MSLLDWLVIGVFVLIVIVGYLFVAVLPAVIVAGGISGLGAHRRRNGPRSSDPPPALPPPH